MKNNDEQPSKGTVFGMDIKVDPNLKGNEFRVESKGMVKKEFLLSKFDGAVRDCTLSDSAKEVVDYVRKIVFDKNSNCEHQWRSWDPIGKNYCAKCGIEMYSKTPKEGSSAEEGETPNDIAWQQGYKAGVKAKNTGNPGKIEGLSGGADIKLTIKQHLWPIRYKGQCPFFMYQEVKLSKGKLLEIIAESLAKNYNAKLSAKSELIPLDDIALHAFAMSCWQESTDKERMVFMVPKFINDVCATFGTKPIVPSVEKIYEILLNKRKLNCTLVTIQERETLIYYAQSIVQYLKDHK